MASQQAVATFERDGMVLLESVVDGELLARLRAAHRRIHRAEQRAGHAAADGSVHLCGILGRDPAHLDMVDHPAVLEVVTGILGWNLHVYHSHLDAHPRIPAPAPARWGWHQDGGRQNVELETSPRPRLSVKIAVFLTDLHRPGRGNLEVIAGSHREDRLERPLRPELGFDPPVGAAPVLARAGDVLVFDRRLWHARGPNLTGPVRRALFFGYTFRWISQRESHGLGPAELERLSPVRSQLIGECGWRDGHWVPDTADLPLRDWMRDRGVVQALIV